MRTKFFFTTVFVVFTFLTNAQKLQLPVKGNAVVFEGNLSINNGVSATGLCSKVKSWIIEITGSRNYNISTERGDNCSVEVEVSNILEPNGIFNDVEATYHIYFTIVEGKISYEIKDIFFKKSYVKYDVSSVYTAYLKNQPLVKEKNETKLEALKRHEYLMNLLNDQVKTLTTSFNNFMNAHVNAVPMP